MSNCSMLNGFMWSQVEEVSSLVSELAKVTKKERALLEQCKDYISLLEAMKVYPFSFLTIPDNCFQCYSLIIYF